jgi:general secretion pathway protein L
LVKMAFVNMGKLWRWWWAEISAFLPAEDSRRTASRKAHLELFAGPGTATLKRNPSLCAPIPQAMDGQTLVDAIERLKPRDRVILTVDATLCLFRRRTIPAGALGHAGQILALDLLRTTPFKKEDVFSGWCKDGSQDGQGGQPVLHAVLRRDLLEKPLSSISARRARPLAIAIRPGSLPAFPIIFDIEGQPFGAANRRRWAKAAAFLALAWLVAASALGITSLNMQAQNLETLQAAFDTVQASALEKRKSLDRFVALKKQSVALAEHRRAEPSVVFLWEELSRLLPDTAWLHSLSISKGTIQIEGLAVAAEELIPLLEAANSFKNVQFASPVYKNPAEPMARFAVKADFERPLP